MRSKIKRLVKHEARRVYVYKLWFLAAIAILLAVFAILAVLGANGRNYGSGEIDRTPELQRYEEELEDYKSYLERYYDDLLPGEKKQIKRQIERYQFFLDTGTVENDYFELDDYMSIKEGYKPFCVCIYIMEYSLFAFMIWAIVGALWALSFDEHTGAMKNLLAAPVGRKAVFGVKTASAATVVMSLPVLAFVIFLIIGACVPDGRFLLYWDGYISVPGIHLMAQIGIRNLVLFACIFAVTLLCSVYFKPLTSALIPILSYFALMFISVMVAQKTQLVFMRLAGFDVANLFPIIGLQNYLNGFDKHCLIIMAAHILGVAITIWLAGRRFRKKDF